MPNVAMETTMDAEMLAFAQDVVLSIQQAKRGEYAVVHTPADIVRRTSGRPVGSVKANPKKPVQIRFDPDVLEALRATGKGWQTRVNDAMREWVKTHSPVTGC